MNGFIEALRQAEPFTCEDELRQLNPLAQAGAVLMQARPEELWTLILALGEVQPEVVFMLDAITAEVVKERIRKGGETGKEPKRRLI